MGPEGARGSEVELFHGTSLENALKIQDEGFKLVVWGTGTEHPHQLFNLVDDPNESANLVDKPEHALRIQALLTKLQDVVDFPVIAKNVAKYGHESMRWWTQNTVDWENEMGKAGLRWHKSWSQDPRGAVAAINTWLERPPQVESCRTNHVWPPPVQNLTTFV